MLGEEAVGEAMRSHRAWKRRVGEAGQSQRRFHQHVSNKLAANECLRVCVRFEYSRREMHYFYIFFL